MIDQRILRRAPWLIEPEVADWELQNAVDEAQFCLLLQSAILYGFITGDANNINQDMCVAMLDIGKRKGVLPDKDYIPEWFIIQAQA